MTGIPRRTTILQAITCPDSQGINQEKTLSVSFHVRNENELVPISDGLLGCPFPSSSICNQDLKITEAVRVVLTAQGQFPNSPAHTHILLRAAACSRFNPEPPSGIC